MLISEELSTIGEDRVKSNRMYGLFKTANIAYLHGTKSMSVKMIMLVEKYVTSNDLKDHTQL